MIKDKENRAEIARRLAAKGMNSSQIARETGFSPGSVLLHAPGEIQETGDPDGLQKP